LADVAATMIANEVDLPDHPGIVRATAESQQLDSDLGDRPVTIAVPVLHRDEVFEALDRGLRVAQRLGKKEGVWGGVIALQGHTRIFGDPSLSKLSANG
jgi:hypothetical protein